MTIELLPGQRFPDIELLDHAANRRRLSQVVGGDPAVLHFFRGWWCPKEQAFFRRLIALQDEAEVAYSRIVSVSIDPPELTAAFRAGLRARWTFFSDADRSVQRELGAVQHARRRVLGEPPQDAVSTLLRDSSRFEGAMTVARGPGVARLADDPFARIFPARIPARILRVGAGLLGAAAPPAGPPTERYGSANPWPWDRFDPSPGDLR